MKKIILLVILSGMAMAAAGQLTETRTVSGFTGISASSAFDITVTKGTAESLVVTADENIMPHVRSEVLGGVLKLYLDRLPRNTNVKNLKAAVTVKELETVKLSGACKLASDAVFTPAEFEAGISGASSLQLTVETGKLSIEASGACKITLDATVKGKAEFDLSGGSKLQSKLRADRLEMDISGACRVELSGSANEAFFDLSGASKIEADNLLLQEATVKASGASWVEVHSEKFLSVRSSGATTVLHKGNPTVTDIKSGGYFFSKKSKKIE
ncbi:MAG: DUF2807 domain-containing protein [Prevotellaceae bacterium]|jgi:hypothetical protein|nr:DUF2807 domain-containing protein [Prevotellaceae bacterium]